MAQHNLFSQKKVVYLSFHFLINLSIIKTNKDVKHNNLVVFFVVLSVVGVSFGDALSGHGIKDNKNLNPMALGDDSGTCNCTCTSSCTCCSCTCSTLPCTCHNVELPEYSL